jgi:prepilin-type processing-associated H-X9-DG protein
MPRIGKCMAKGGSCVNQKNVLTKGCNCLVFCNVCFADNHVMSSITNCPVCKVHWAVKPSGLRIHV